MASRSPLSTVFRKTSRDTMVRLTCQVRTASLASAVVAVALTPVAVAGDSSRSGFGKGGWTSVCCTDAIAPQANGKIVLVGGDGWYLMRLLADGRIDRSFGKHGFVEHVLRPVPCETTCLRPRVAVGGDGKIVIAQNSDQRSVLTRWRGDGRLDRTFGVGGSVSIVGSAQVTALAVAPKGAIVVVRTPRDPYRYRPLLDRFLANGKVDTRFGNAGRTRIASRQPVAVLVQPGGKIVVAGNDISLARYRSDGSPDNSFGSNSIVRIKGFVRQSAALDPDRSIVLAGGGVPRAARRRSSVCCRMGNSTDSSEATASSDTHTAQWRLERGSERGGGAAARSSRDRGRDPTRI